MEGRAIFISKVENGRLKTTGHSSKIAAILQSYDGQAVKISIEKYNQPRSLNQNAYYWGVTLKYILAILRDNNPNATIEDAHEFCKLESVGNLISHKILVVKEATHVLVGLKSTSSLTTAEFEAYLERIRKWALDICGVTIPLPNEEVEQFYIEPRET